MEKLTLKVDTGAVTVDVENENGKKDRRVRVCTD